MVFLGEKEKWGLVKQKRGQSKLRIMSSNSKVPRALQINLSFFAKRSKLGTLADRHCSTCAVRAEFSLLKVNRSYCAWTKLTDQRTLMIFAVMLSTAFVQPSQPNQEK